ncbi:MAG: periplasmic heavy metal sensor [Rhodobacter sp.]|nr:periplasmic heavy metal sensor [Rhodobacter sp.]
MADTNPPKPRKRRRWGKVVLFVSLAFNLLVVGLIAGAILSGPRDRDRNPLLRDLGFGPYAQALPAYDKIALTRALRREAGAFRENRAVLRQQFEAFLAALRAEPYDHAEVTRLVTSQQDRIQDRQRLGRDLLLERIAAMDAAERAAYADALDKSLRRRKPNRPPRGE